MKKHTFQTVNECTALSTRNDLPVNKKTEDEVEARFSGAGGSNSKTRLSNRKGKVQGSESSLNKKDKAPDFYLKMKDKSERNLTNILAVKAEQIRHRLATQLKEDDDDVEDFPLLEKNRKTAEDENGFDFRQDTYRMESPAELQSKIPVSKARIRRRQIIPHKILGSKNAEDRSHQIMPKSKSIKSTVKIQNYRPGYTWSRGGRVKELRIRCLARKYLFIWRKNTFGRVPLYAAVHHYEVSLKRQAFDMWYDFWWEIVKEWRLAVRAECHHRYKLGCTMFKAWREFILLRRIKNEKNRIAKKHCDQKQLAHSWVSWKLYISEKRAQQKLKRKAEEFQEMRILRYSWYVWKSQHRVTEERKEQEALALQFWSYRLQAQYWLVWKSAVHERHRVQEQMANVCMYHNSVLATRCLNAWKLYTANRRAKKSHKAFACRMYQHQLKTNCFRHWSHRWSLACSLRRHHHRMEEIALTFRLRWVVWRWNQYVDMNKQMKQKEAMAIDHYQQHLKHFGLASFRLNVVHSRIKDMRRKLSQQLEVSQLQRRFFNQWVEAYDQREEDRMATSTAMAHQCYSSNLMLKCFSALVDYSQRRKNIKALYAQADAHFYLHVMPKCLFHMKIHVQIEKTCRHNAMAAKCFYIENTQRKVFAKWKTDAEQIRDQRMLYRMAILHREAVVSKSFFSLWRERAMEMEEERQKTEMAHRHFLCTLCHQVLQAWWGVVLIKRKRETNYIRAIQFHSRKVKIKSVTIWKKWINERKEKKLKKEMAEGHRRRRVFTMCIKDWKALWEQGKTFQSSANAFLAKRCQIVVQLAFYEWKIVTRQLAVKRKEKVEANIHYNRCLISKVMHEWRNWAVVHAYRQAQTRQLLENALTQLKKLKLQMYFKKWQGELSKAKQMYLKQDEADHHHQRVLQNKLVGAWKEYTSECLRQRLLHGQSEKFNSVRLTAKHFYIWRVRWLEKIEENSKTELALWYWSLTLERKVLYAWKEFKDNQKHRKSRLMDAALFRRQRLLQNACCQWLTTADSLSQVRASSAARYQTKAVMESFRLVQRCALHWKTWTRRRRAEKGKGTRSDLAASSLSPTVASKVRLTPSTIEFQTIPSSELGRRATIPSWNNVIKPKAVASSPIRLTSTDWNHASQRRPPTRPSFLMESLQRAGLSDYLFSDYSDNQDTDKSGSDSQSTLVEDGSDENVQQTLPSSPEHPTTGRFSPHVKSPGHPSVHNAIAMHYSHEQANSSFSAEVLSGSTSSVGPSGSGVRPLHLDSGEQSSSHTTSSLSPQLFTPSTQRSQFSGNPLLNSSPVSDTGRSRPITTRIDGEGEEGLLDSDSDGKMVSGNLGKDSHSGLQRLQFWEEQQHKRQEQRELKIEDSDGVKTTDSEGGAGEPVVLLKPEYFMQKPPSKIPRDKVERKKSADDGVKFTVKNTPRSFATWDTSSAGADGVFSDFAREGKGMLRHTPRELTSPRRAPPQGILHNKVSDSDADVSPLNTARSRGTVTFASPKSPTPEEEIVSIRDRLRHFSQQKRKLRSLQKKYQLLLEWIEEQDNTGRSSERTGHEEEEDSRSATEELDLVRLEVAQLQTVVDGQQPLCEKLVQRAQVLAAQLNLPF